MTDKIDVHNPTPTKPITEVAVGDRLAIRTSRLGWAQAAPVHILTVGRRVLNVHRQSCDYSQEFRDAHKGTVSDYDDDYRGPERAMWHIEPVYRRAKGRA